MENNISLSPQPNKSLLSVRYWQNKLYQNPIDPGFELIKKVESVMGPESVILDFGAGAGSINGYHLKGHCREVIGVDFDPRVTENPLLDRGIQLKSDQIPLPDNSVDIIFSIYVFEHIANPKKTVKELNRVLKPGGQVFALTPSKWHYVALAAASTPLKFHKWFNRNRGFSGDDTFPTCYRLNTKADLQRHFGESYEWELSYFETQPNYLKFNVAFFLAGVAYERIVNRFSSLEPLRVNLIASAVKKS